MFSSVAALTVSWLWLMACRPLRLLFHNASFFLSLHNATFVAALLKYCLQCSFLDAVCGLSVVHSLLRPGRYTRQSVPAAIARSDALALPSCDTICVSPPLPAGRG
eukprot:5208354-Pleurochrysis_carterae.AAC.2